MTHTITLRKDMAPELERLQERLPSGKAGLYPVNPLNNALNLANSLMRKEARGATLCTYGREGVKDFLLKNEFLKVAEKRPSSQKITVQISDKAMDDLARVHHYMVENNILDKTSKPADALDVVISFAHSLLDQTKGLKRELGLKSEPNGRPGSYLIAGFNLTY